MRGLGRHHVPAHRQAAGGRLPRNRRCDVQGAFDIIGDTLRGTRGIIADMFNQPDALLEACDRVARIAVKWVTRARLRRAAYGLHAPAQGRDGFMSDEQLGPSTGPACER